MVLTIKRPFLLVVPPQERRAAESPHIFRAAEWDSDKLNTAVGHRDRDQVYDASTALAKERVQVYYGTPVFNIYGHPFTQKYKFFGCFEQCFSSPYYTVSLPQPGAHHPEPPAAIAATAAAALRSPPRREASVPLVTASWPALRPDQVRFLPSGGGWVARIAIWAIDELGSARLTNGGPAAAVGVFAGTGAHGPPPPSR